MNWRKLPTLIALLPAGFTAGQEFAQEQVIGKAEVVATFTDQMPTGVTVSSDGRIFLNFPRWGDPVSYSVAELKDGKAVPYPDAEMSQPDPAHLAERFPSVQSVVVDATGKRLWILDTGRIEFQPPAYGGPKLIGIDLSTNQIFKKVLFPRDVVLPGSYLNDVRFDLNRGKEGTAFITDSSNDGPNAIIVVDLATGRSWRRLNNHPSTRFDPSFIAFVESQPLMLRSPGQKPQVFHAGADGIAISPDGRWIYYCPLSSRHLYRVSADALADRARADSEAVKSIEDLGEKGASDGLESDAQGRVYITDYEHDAIHRRGTDGSIETLLHDPRLLWPDTLSLASDGYLYVTSNQLERQAAFHDGQDRRQRPFVLFRIKTDGRRITQ